jgi:hypothetical protein
MVRRLVGFHEYGHALDHLDKLTDMCDEEDIVAINQILADRPEFDLFVAMPDGIQKEGSPSEGREREEDRRSGLEWVIGLARVEFGAMVSGFSSHPDPYQWVQPKSIAYTATLQLLLEGVAGHYQALKNSAQIDEQLGKIYDDQVKSALAKARRVRIARMMLHTLGKAGLETYTGAQAERLGLVQNDLDRTQNEMRRVIRAFLSAWTLRETTTSISQREVAIACRAQLAAEQRELAAGTATVTHFPVDRQ